MNMPRFKPKKLCVLGSVLGVLGMFCALAQCFRIVRVSCRARPAHGCRAELLELAAQLRAPLCTPRCSRAFASLAFLAVNAVPALRSPRARLLLRLRQRPVLRFCFGLQLDLYSTLEIP